MSKHNYSQYSNKNNVDVEETVVEETVVAETPVVEETVVVETPAVEVESVEKHQKPAPKPKTVTGTVVGCTKLNVREAANPTATPVCVLDAASEIKIDVAKSTNEWFKVCTATGVEGYCMRKFVKASL